MKNLTKIEEGWYKDSKGIVYQKWWMAENSPSGKAGWYVSFPGPVSLSVLGPYKTLKSARFMVSRRK